MNQIKILALSGSHTNPTHTVINQGFYFSNISFTLPNLK